MVGIFTYLVARGALARLVAAGPSDWAAGMIFVVIALALGWLTGGRVPETRRTFAITTAARNLALALLIAGELFPGGGVQLALFGIWVICTAADVAFARATRTGPQQTPQPA